MIQAVLFDMDGVLVDSEPFIREAAVQMFLEKGIHVQEEDFLPFVGAGEDRYLGGVAQKYGYHLEREKDKARTYEIYKELTRGRLSPLPGVNDFIRECRKKGLKTAVATSADEFKMKINLKEAGITIESFDATVNGLQIRRKKPFPDIFLKAASLLDTAPQNCLVVEDAPNGIEAASAAGSRCLALTTSFSEKDLRQADWIAGDLSGVPAEALDW